MKRNFTLLEMLIVAAVIAILAGLLFPALSAARAGGRKTACMNLLKQYSLACSAYVADYGGYYPDVRHYLEPESAFVRYFGNGGVMPEKIARCPGDASTEALRKVPRWRTAENTFLKVSIGGSASNLSDTRMPSSNGMSVHGGAPICRIWRNIRFQSAPCGWIIRRKKRYPIRISWIRRRCLPEPKPGIPQ